uniref:Integrase catalytic domain-containing protein n=1 Tax=Nicotiana tabacum TaxID=4097 RepID=A0A1S4C2M7_TOBAC|nr:PREDICTED: uncharacterized protein LOC107814509 [Nicotiana tabacum]
MPFGLKNAGATYTRAMTIIFHDMIHKEIEVFVDDVIVKSRKQSDHVRDLRKFFQRLRSRFTAQLITTCGPIFKLLKKDVAVAWTGECQEAFDKIKKYLWNPPVLVPPEPGRPLILYLIVLDNSFGYVLGQHDVTGRKEQAIYYLSKKFTAYKRKKPGWKLFFDGAANMKSVGIGAMLISEEGHHYAVTAQLRFYCTNNMAEYEACILGLRVQAYTRIHNEVAHAIATSASMLHHPDKAYVDPIHIQVHDQHAYCNMLEEELDGEPWFHEIKENIRMDVYPVQATSDQKRTIYRLSNWFFFSKGILSKRMLDLRLLRFFEHNIIGSPWRGIVSASCENVINVRPIEPAAANGHRFILVAIDYFTKWVEAKTFKAVTKKAVVDFVHENIICRFGNLKTLITDNGANLNSNLMKKLVKARLEQLSLIDEKRLAIVYHSQLYQWRMARAYNKKVCPRKFEVGQLVLKRILPHREEAKGKFAPNWPGPFVVSRVLSNGALYITDMEGKFMEMAINSDAVKRYYV